jgi:hypothetical protein
MGQLEPGFLTIRVYKSDHYPIEIDMDEVRRGLSTRRAGMDIVFDLRIIAVASDGQRASAYLIPWDRLQDAGAKLQKTRDDLAEFTAPLPVDVDPMAVAREMALLS